MEPGSGGLEYGAASMDIGTLVASVEKVQSEVLRGNVVEAIQTLFRMKKSGLQVDFSALQEVLDIPNYVKHLFDETNIGDAVTATKCLAALKGLHLDVDSRQIDYVRYKKMSMLGNASAEEHAMTARPEFRSLIMVLRSFHVIVGDFRECSVHSADEGVSCQEEITLRFPNLSFRDTFLQTAFRVALEHDLNFTWENRASIFNQDMTGHIGWFVRHAGKEISSEAMLVLKKRFDRFINALVAEVEHFGFLRCIMPEGSLDHMKKIIFSRDTAVASQICSALSDRNAVGVHDLDTLLSWFADADNGVSAFVFHLSIRDFDVIQAMVNFKLMRDKVGPPFIVLAEDPFFLVMKDPFHLFSGCEFLQLFSPEAVSQISATIVKTAACRRRFVRIPVDIRCHANLRTRSEHTRVTPVSPAGAFLKTHKAIPVFAPAEIHLYDPESGFEETIVGNVIYNQRGGSAVRFDNVISFEKFKQLRAMTLSRHRRVVDTFQRSVL